MVVLVEVLNEENSEFFNFKKVYDPTNYDREGKISDKNSFLAQYKFSICFENSKEYGYGTEKLFQSFAAGTIPIYWGDDSMLEIYNNKSYIHIRNEDEFEEKIKYIIEIDKNDTLYNEIIHQNIYNDK